MSFTQRLKKQISGFTLIELLVVVLILGILASVAVAYFSDQRSDAEEATARANVRIAASNIASDYAKTNQLATSGTVASATWNQTSRRLFSTSGDTVCQATLTSSGSLQGLITCSGNQTLANTSLPVISGSAMPGATLTVSNGTWTGTGPIDYLYQWQQSTDNAIWSDISAATGLSYVLPNSSAGKYYRVRVTASNGIHSDVAATSTATDTVFPAWQATTIPSKTWQGIAGASSSNLLMAVPSNGNPQRSTNGGASWTELVSIGGQNRIAVSGGGEVVAAATNGGIYANVNQGSGAWRTGPSSLINWTSLAVNNNGDRLYIVSAGGRIYRSNDLGIFWGSRFENASIDFTSVATDTSGAKVLAVASGGQRVYSGDSGNDNTFTTTTASANYQVVAYGSGKFVGLTQSGTGFYTSNGSSYTDITTPTGQWISMAYGSGYFVAVSADGKTMSSPDGINWTERTSVIPSALKSVTYSNGAFYAVASSGTTRLMKLSFN